MNNLCNCDIVISCINRNKKQEAFRFFTKAFRFIPTPALVEFTLEGTTEEIYEITGDSGNRFVVVRLSNGQVNFDENNSEPNGSVNMMGYLDREGIKYVRIEFDLSTGQGKIVRLW